MKDKIPENALTIRELIAEFLGYESLSAVALVPTQPQKSRMCDGCRNEAGQESGCGDCPSLHMHGNTFEKDEKSGRLQLVRVDL